MNRSVKSRATGLAALAAAGLVAAAGCGGSSTSSSGASSSVTSSASTTSAAATSAAAGGSSAALFSQLPAKVQQAKKIVVGSSIDYPPFEYYAADGKTLQGFEVELANALEPKLGVKFDWNNAAFDTLFSALKAGRYDMVYGATNDTPEREQSFTFVDYLQASQGFDVAKGNPSHIATVNDLCGKSIAAVRGGIQAQWLTTQSSTCTKSGKGAINVLTFDGNSGEQLAVREGKAAALLENYPTAVDFAKQSSGALQLVPNLQVAKTYFGMVIPKSSTQLSTALQKAWQAIIDDGTYGKVLAKSGLSAIALPKALINGATTQPATQ